MLRLESKADKVHFEIKSSSNHTLSLLKVSTNPREGVCRQVAEKAKEYQKLMDEWDKKRAQWTEAQKIEHEKKKYLILEGVSRLMSAQYGALPLKKDSKKEKQKSSLWRKMTFVFLIVVDIVFMSIGGYLGSIELLNLLIPSIKPIVAIIIATIATAIESVMMYSIFKPLLQKGLAIKAAKLEETRAVYYEKRLDLLESMNSTMINNLSKAQLGGSQLYQSFAISMKIFNGDMKKVFVPAFKESLLNRAIRYGLSSLNLVLNIAGAYFGITMFLAAICAPLLGTPVGWAIIGTLIFAQLLTRFVIRKDSIFDLLNPHVKQEEMIRKKINKFEDRSDDISQRLNLLVSAEATKVPCKQSLSKKVSHEEPSFFKPCRSVNSNEISVQSNSSNPLQRS